MILKNPNSVAYHILKNIEDGILLINNNQKIIVCNPAASQITGFSPQEILNQDWFTILQLVNQHGFQIKSSQHPIQQALQEKKVIREQNSYILSKKRQRIPLHIIISPLMHRNKIKALICVMRDMCLEKQQEAAKTDFVSTASHEMRTPLATLEGYLTLASQQKDLKENQKYLNKAHQTVMHLGKLFKDLLTTSQSEDGQLSHQPKSFNLSHLLKQVSNHHQKQAKAKMIDLRTHLLDNALIKADPQRIEELFSNLLDNALKYTSDKGFIQISLSAVEIYWQVQIKDNGLGISQRDQAHLFQKFYRVNNQYPGTGLGLFICKKIVELYQGDIWLESQLDQGSIFYVNLPKLTNQTKS